MDEDWITLIPHGITPSGWGVFEENEQLGMLTPCCGVPTSGGTCTACNASIHYRASATIWLHRTTERLAEWVAQVTDIPLTELAVDKNR